MGRADRKKHVQFVFVVFIIALVWLVVLPKIGRTAPMRKMIDRNQSASIDPSAFFYTDLEHLHYDAGVLRRDG